jgi:SAM-dependent methyltransferase
MSTAYRKLDVIHHFPGWDKAPTFLQNEILSRALHSVADLGGGANPMLGEEFVAQNGIDYTVLDISAAELAKAPAYCRKIQVDITAPESEFKCKVGENRFDLVFSHMFLEHVRSPLIAHRNIYSALKPGGVAIHLFPSANNLPLAVNRLIPDGLTQAIVRIMQPHRDLSGVQGKFPAYYAMCGSPTRRMHRKFEALGYKVVRHTGFIGHAYYRRLPLLRKLEARMRPVLAKAGIPMTGAMLLILQK